VRPWAPRAVVVLFGLFLAAIGDGLPRTRPNQLFGIRTQVERFCCLHRVA
jgi:hypothetical protein